MERTPDTTPEPLGFDHPSGLLSAHRQALSTLDGQLHLRGHRVGVVVVVDAVHHVRRRGGRGELEQQRPVLLVHPAGAGAGIGGVVDGLDVQAALSSWASFSRKL